MDLSNFPEFTEQLDDVVTINTTGDEPGVSYMKDIVYATYGDVKRHLQLLVPVSRNKPVFPPMPPEMKAAMGIPDIKKTWSYPCLVYVQGSAWGVQDCYGELANLTKYAQMGYVVALVQYRDYTITTFPAPIIDARNAVRFLKIHAEDFAIDPEKIILSGSSSGGHTAVYAGIFHDDDEDTNLYPGVSGEVKGIVNFYGSTDVSFPDSNPVSIPNHCEADSPEGMEMGGIDLNKRPDLIDKLTVAHNIFPETEIVPTLHIHGTKDIVVNTKCSVKLYKRLKECGKDTTLYLLKGANHGGAEFYTPEVLSIVDNFIKRVLAQ